MAEGFGHPLRVLELVKKTVMIWIGGNWTPIILYTLASIIEGSSDKRGNKNKNVLMCIFTKKWLHGKTSFPDLRVLELRNKLHRFPIWLSKQYFSAEKCIVIVSPTQWQLEQQYKHQINLINMFKAVNYFHKKALS